MQSLRQFIYLTFLISFIGCGNKTAKTVSVKSSSTTSNVAVPLFNPDSAYKYIEEQVQFGPRVPNSEAHKACGKHLTKKLQSFGAKISLQEVDLKGYNDVIYASKNIIASFKPEHPNRIIICAHWDSRHVADQEQDKTKINEPIDGANDGASGVGVILELARLMQQQAPGLGVDLILFDTEDQGTPSFSDGDYQANSWCLGSQYWAQNHHKPGYKAKYGILLDMVGAENAIFPREGFSMQYAPELVNKVWDLAASLGYGSLFTKQRSYPVTDDHYFVNKLAKIPCIDIIHYSPGQDGGFGEFWHTHNDNMSVIHKQTLFAVGDVLTHLIYQNP